jgi:hypothetical protein
VIRAFDDDLARAMCWFAERNPDLGYQTPSAAVLTPSGCKEVLALACAIAEARRAG